ncbi:MAG: amidohydrolase [Chloroflexi bacterium]|nr:amidohydrolase [Chloroflexota bacterium]
MVVAEPRSRPETAPQRTRTRRALIDCDFHDELDSIKDLYPYLSQRWRDHIDMYGTRGALGGYYPRFMDHREDARPPSGRRSGSECRHSVKDYLDPFNVAYATLIPLTPAGRQSNPDFDAALATAVNDWQVAEWLDVDSRLRASMIIPFEFPDRAVAEIERRASDKRFVQVQFSGRPHEPMGRRKYWPIYEACAKHDLRVMSHAFGSNGNPITGTGWPSFYIEDHVGPAQAMQANIISLVAEGVFDTFPTLKVVSVENGFAWIPSLMWRMDDTYKLLRSEVPHLKRFPSEYIREHVYLTTQPVEEPHKPEYFLQMLEQFGDMVSHILFASDYPHWDSDNPDMALPALLPESVKNAIYYENARALHNLPDTRNGHAELTDDSHLERV